MVQRLPGLLRLLAACHGEALQRQRTQPAGLQDPSGAANWQCYSRSGGSQ